MRITQSITPLLPLLRAGGLNAHVRGWDRALRSLFPITDQSSGFVKVIYRGRPYAAEPNQYVDWQVLTSGGYEVQDLAVFEVLGRHLRSNPPLVLDIGTNIGHHMFVFATLGWRVLAFEPNPALWPSIEAKIRAGNLCEVALHKVGLGDQDTALQFEVPVAENSGTGHFVLEADASAGHSKRRLPIRGGDNYLAQHDVGPVDLIKIDIQGFEASALRGLRGTIASCRPILSVEIGNENRETIPTLESLAALLPVRYGFRMMRHDRRFLFLLPRLVRLTEEEFSRVDGNVFCVPEEYLSILDAEFRVK